MQISVDSAAFSARLRGDVLTLQERMQEKIVGYATTLIQTLVANTPIQTGQARANWTASLGAASDSFIGGPKSLKPPSSIDYSAHEAQSIGAIKGWTSGQTIFINNNAPYIQRLNDGYSRQAPAGFVEAALQTAKSEFSGI